MVAKTELRTLFYSPIAWFLMIVFLIQCGIVYLQRAWNGIARSRKCGGMDHRWEASRHSQNSIFSEFARGLFSSVDANLYLYIPLLTMSLISRETGSGTIKLLYSSPIKVREIVFGKYLAMMVYSLLLRSHPVGVFVVSGIFHIQHPETGMLMTALAGFLLAAVRLFGHRPVHVYAHHLPGSGAPLHPFVMIGILSYIGTLWQRIGFVRELTYFLSISGRTQKMLAGLLTTKDIVYFFAIVVHVPRLQCLLVERQHGIETLTVKGLRYAVVLGIVLLVGYVTSIPGLIGLS